MAHYPAAWSGASGKWRYSHHLLRTLLAQPLLWMRLKNIVNRSVLTGLRLMSRALSPSLCLRAIEAESHSGRRTRIIG